MNDWLKKKTIYSFGVKTGKQQILEGKKNNTTKFCFAYVKFETRVRQSFGDVKVDCYTSFKFNGEV